MPNYEVGFSYMQKMYGQVDKLPADNIDDVDEKAEVYFREMFITDGDEVSDFMVESIMEVSKNGE